MRPDIEFAKDAHLEGVTPYEAPTLVEINLLDETARGDSPLPDEPGDPF